MIECEDATVWCDQAGFTTSCCVWSTKHGDQIRPLAILVGGNLCVRCVDGPRRWAGWRRAGRGRVWWRTRRRRRRRWQGWRRRGRWAPTALKEPQCIVACQHVAAEHLKVAHGTAEQRVVRPPRLSKVCMSALNHWHDAGAEWPLSGAVAWIQSLSQYAVGVHCQYPGCA